MRNLAHRGEVDPGRVQETLGEMIRHQLRLRDGHDAEVEILGWHAEVFERTGDPELLGVMYALRPKTELVIEAIANSRAEGVWPIRTPRGMGPGKNQSVWETVGALLTVTQVDSHSRAHLLWNWLSRPTNGYARELEDARCPYVGYEVLTELAAVGGTAGGSAVATMEIAGEKVGGEDAGWWELAARLAPSARDGDELRRWVCSILSS